MTYMQHFAFIVFALLVWHHKVHLTEKIPKILVDTLGIFLTLHCPSHMWEAEARS